MVRPGGLSVQVTVRLAQHLGTGAVICRLQTDKQSSVSSKARNHKIQR